MAHLLLLILQNPRRSVAFLYTFLAQTTLILLKRLCLPHLPFFQSVRIQLQRAYLSAAALHFPEIVHRLPVECSESRAQRIGHGWTGYIIPGTKSLTETSGNDFNFKKCIALYAHGGGYARGEARMYLNYMERWIERAAEMKIDLVFVSVEYREFSSCTRPARSDTDDPSPDHRESASCTENIVHQSVSAPTRRRSIAWTNHLYGRLRRRYDIPKLVFL